METDTDTPRLMRVGQNKGRHRTRGWRGIRDCSLGLGLGKTGSETISETTAATTILKKKIMKEKQNEKSKDENKLSSTLRLLVNMITFTLHRFSSQN